MNRIDICKNIIQSIKDYITTPEKLEPHRAKNHFVRKRKLSLFQVIMYLLYTSKASMFQNLSRIRKNLGCLDFPDISKQALSKARQFINPALFKALYYLSVDLFYKRKRSPFTCVHVCFSFYFRFKLYAFKKNTAISRCASLFYHCFRYSLGLLPSTLRNIRLK